MALMLETVRDETGQEICLPCTPGGRNASDIINGDGVAVAKEFVFIAERSLLIGLGLYAAGFRGMKMIQGTVAGTLAMEAFVFGYVLFQRARKR
jgi:hypothetical protein